jgi:hypothetical protein
VTFPVELLRAFVPLKSAWTLYVPAWANVIAGKAVKGSSRM